MNGLPPELAAALDAPPRDFLPTAIWWWSGESLTRARLRWQLERLVEGGVPNLVVLNLAPSGPLFGSDADDPAFLSEAWWELLEGVCDDAEELGARLWFYDQLGFSGADLQARLVDASPAFAGRRLGRVRLGDALPSGAVELAVTGGWRVFHQPWGFDYLSGAACAALLDGVHGEFARRLGSRLGGVIAGSFQDELPALPTWATGFEELFAERYGYSLVERVLALWGDDDGGPDAWRVRRDYHALRAALAEDAFFRPLAEWHERHGLLVGCDQQDPARGGRPVDGVRLYADYARTHRWFSAPGSDHHGDARLHSSLAHLYGRERVWIEAFHSSGWGGTLEETFDWLLPWLRAGATLYDPHAVYATTKQGWWEWAPPSTDWRQPYWRHHRVFAEAVARLCAALSLGDHVCDVAVLFPTATAQAGTSLDGVDDAARRAQDTYVELTGDMAWFHTVPGTLDELGLDADVLDDDSAARAVVGDDGRLRVAGEAYRAVVLPACTVLEGATARRLVELLDAGGEVVCVGALPERGVGDADADAAVAALRARLGAPVTDLAAALAGVRPRVTAPVPPLVRSVDGALLVFLTATFPRASDVAVGAPDERGADLGWLDVTCDFDPARYAREMRVRIRDVDGPVLRVGAFDGEPVALACEPVEDGVEVVVPFDDGPAALLVIPDAVGASPPPPAAAGAPPAEPFTPVDLGTTWTAELVPTLDDAWGDFGGPRADVERWAVGGEHATFGVHAEWRAAGEEAWRPLAFSTTRGIHKDPIHRPTLGPKGRVPEELFDLGDVAAGATVTVRTALRLPADAAGAPGLHLAVGAPAAKRVRLDGADVALDDRGYLALAPVALGAGPHLLDIDLTPDEALTLRGYVAVVRDPARFLRPEWIGGGTTLSTIVALDEVPEDAALQVAAAARAVVRVNGVEAGRQGGFEPYEVQGWSRVRRYDVRALLRPGANTVAIEVEGGAVLVDGLVASGPEWRADGGPCVVRRRQDGDPAALHLPPRPHPLPGATWLDGVDDGTVVPVVLARPDTTAGTVALPLDLPPGTTRVEADAHGDAALVLDDGRALPLPADLPPGSPPRAATLRLATAPGFEGGAALAGPLRFTVGAGPVGLGDWEEQGLAEYSGGVRYRTTLTLDGPPPAGAVLDLGRVRGTAEVTVNGRPLGVRVCSPYVVAAGDALRAGANEIEILVLGTLAPYLDAVSPTHFVFGGQRATGLFGPVVLRPGKGAAPA